MSLVLSWEKLCDRGYMIASGGASGFIEAVFKGYHHSDTYRPGYTLALFQAVTLQRQTLIVI